MIESIPFQLCTPTQKDALAKARVGILEPASDNAGRASMKAYEEWLGNNPDGRKDNMGNKKISLCKDTESFQSDALMGDDTNESYGVPTVISRSCSKADAKVQK